MPRPAATIAGQLQLLGSPFPLEQRIGHIEMLLAAPTRKEFEEEVRRRGSSADLEQILLPPFRGLWRSREAIRILVVARLSNLGVTHDLIEPYFTDMGTQPYVLLYDKYGRGKPNGWAQAFIETTRDILFETLKDWAMRKAE